MLNFTRPPDTFPTASFHIPCASSLDFSCLDSCLTSHPKFASGYECGYEDYFQVEGACPGDMVCGVPVTAVEIVVSISRSLLESEYHGEPDLFFWLVGACAGFLAAVAHDHGKQAQAGLVVLASLSCVLLSEVLAC